MRKILAVAGRVCVRSGYLHMLDLLAGLTARGCRVVLVCASMPQEMAAAGLGFEWTLWTALPRGITGLVRGESLEGFFARTEAQVVHVHGTSLHWTGRRFLARIRAPVVFTPYSAREHPREVYRIQRQAHCVVALSEFMREGLVNRCSVPREKLRIVPPGIEVSRYEYFPPQFGARTPVVGTVAPLAADRGQAVFLQAARQLLDSGREAEFVVAGDGPQEGSLRRLAARLGIEKRVTFVTNLVNYRSVISALDIFVRPGLVGGLGYTVLEAMAMGKAVIATSVGDIPELIVEGRTGLMAPKGDTGALVELIGRLLDHPEQALAMGEAARRSVAERFGMDALVENTLRVYAEAVEAFSRAEAEE